MGLFSKSKSATGPYKDESRNLIYELLFCDDLEFYKLHTSDKKVSPWTTLFADAPNRKELQKLIMDENTESRVKLLAYKKLQLAGEPIEEKELLGVIVEVAMEEGLDVLASFRDGTARYINHSEKMIIWETTDQTSSEITAQLFRDSANIVQRIGPWNKPRLPHPSKGKVRLTFLVSDGIYFGEGEINSFFNDPLAAPALQSATALMQYLTSKA
ncbi:MAG: hypothetical protein IPP15_04515 [Saprospiraceae bacterium]|uniref:Uncharacterized protein n=1 Tax=Candidatus Opimibacter skivensis TaxID=2982028 RepID=A0A9D7SRF4_9BACT|nr:hypothetical protein [Candidatus Opimibacter skivensis]